MTRTEAYIQMLYGNKVEHPTYPGVSIYMDEYRNILTSYGSYFTTSFLEHPNLEHGWSNYVDSFKWAINPFSTGGIPPFELVPHDSKL